MKKVQVFVKDQNTLVLKENAYVGDYIDLTSLQEVDYSSINRLIEEGKDKTYLQRFEEVKKSITLEYENKLAELNSQINLLKVGSASALKEKESEIEKKNLNAIAELKRKIDILENSKSADIELTKNEKDKEIAKLLNEMSLKQSEHKVEIANVKNGLLEEKSKLMMELEKLKLEKDKALIQKEADMNMKYTTEISELKKRIDLNEATKKADISLAIAEKDNEINKLMSENKTKENDYNYKIKERETELKELYEGKIREKEEEIIKLNFQKSLKNVKQTGADLEAWCDGEIRSYMQNGLANCTWEKDNFIIKDEGEAKGSKADFIFKIYQSEKHAETELLASVCIDMKDENPDSTNKKKNEDYYKQLDINRNKKGCKYALLVSNLELDKPNILPIYKVNNYNDMYVVRPAYMMTFINMLVSLTVKFKDLLINVEKEKMELQDALALAKEFDSLKLTYLDKPLELLRKEIESIQKSSESIKKSALAIDDSCTKIIDKYINEINSKLDKFNIRKLTKELVRMQ